MTREKQLLEIEGLDNSSFEEDQTTQEGEPLTLDAIQDNATGSHQELKRNHSIWRNISDVIEDYLQRREDEATSAVEDLSNQQREEYFNLEEEQDEDLEGVREETTSKLGGFLSRSLQGMYDSAKSGLALVPDLMQLVEHLDAKDDLGKKPIGKNLIQVLNAAGGVRSFTEKNGLIDYKGEEDNSLKKIIGGVNNFLNNNEGVKSWLRTAVKMAMSTEK